MRPLVWSALFLLIWYSPGAPAPPPALHLLDAVNAALAHHPELELQRQEVEIGNAVQKQAAGAFDQLLETGVDQGRQYSPFTSPLGFALSPTDASNITASYSKLLRNGMTVNGSLQMSRQIDGATMPDGLNTSSTRFQLVVPLMRGRGTQVTTATERAAGLRRDSAVLELRNTTATVMRRVVSSYWALVAAARSRDVAAESARRGEALVENTRTLIDADQSPRSDLAFATANAADREAGRIAADQAYVAAEQQLWLDVGYGRDDRPEVAALDDFSLFGTLPNAADLPENAGALVAGALQRRTDYLAAQRLLDAARVVRDAAADGLRPQVDFSVNAGYTSLAQGRAFGTYWSAVASGIQGPDVFGQITYRLPIENRRASGLLLEADAELREATVRRDDLARTIKASIVTSYSAVRNSLLRLDRARESVKAFQEALQGEQDKLALGIGSIIDLLTTEDRLTTAEEGQVAAWQSYGDAIIDFRFATGSLVPPDTAQPAVDVHTLTAFPAELVRDMR